MKIKFLVDEDFINYKKTSMFIGFPTCSFKCGIENCQNKNLINEKDIEMDYSSIIERYCNNKITSSIVCGGMEPFDSFKDLYELIYNLRIEYNNSDDVVIYTGYNEDEIKELIDQITIFNNIVIKFGRYIPGDTPHKDDILEVELASNNQYAKEYRRDSTKVFVNPDKKIVDKIREKLSSNGGYCPCVRTVNDDNKCMCKEFRDKIANHEVCECHCGLYLNL